MMVRSSTGKLCCSPTISDVVFAGCRLPVAGQNSAVTGFGHCRCAAGIAGTVPLRSLPVTTTTVTASIVSYRIASRRVAPRRAAFRLVPFDSRPSAIRLFANAADTSFVLASNCHGTRVAVISRIGSTASSSASVLRVRQTMANLRQTPLTCSGHTRPVVHLAFSDVTESGYYLISACKDGKPMLRQGDTGDWIGTFEGHKGAVWGVALNPQATRAATGAADFNAKVWDAIKGEEIHSFQHKHIVKSVNFSSDANYLVTGSNEKVVRIYDLNKPEAAPQILSGHTNFIRHVTFFNNDTTLVSCADDKTLRVWDRNTGQEVKKLDFPATPNSMEVSKDGSIITTTHSNIVTFWNSKELTKLREYTVPTQMNSASLHPDCSIFVCGGEDLKVYKFDYATGTEIESFKGHFGPVHCVRFSPDGELYASGSEDGTLRLWQTTVGKTYGLWRCIEQQTTSVQESTAVLNNKQEVPAS